MKEFFRHRKWYKIIKKSGLFDERYYLFSYKDVRDNDIDPIVHYIKFGARERRNPSSNFDTSYYLNAYQDVDRDKINPLVHYILFGRKEGRNAIEERRGEEKKNNQTEKKELSFTTSKEMLSISKEVENSYIRPLSSEPLVSILILTRNGMAHIKRLLFAISKNTIYRNFEIIVVDNCSTDGTVDYLEENKFGFDLKIIRNSENKSFSFANNQAANLAKGEYLLLLNNDVEPLYGWLTQLVSVAENVKNVGSVGAQLIYPFSENDAFSCKVQHAGIAFRYDFIDFLGLEFFRPYNIGIGRKPIIKSDRLEYGERIALTAACLLVKKKLYFEVGGLDEGYNYGYEDVDLGLKIYKKGLKNLYVQNSILFHYESSTQKKSTSYEIRTRRIENIKLLEKKWSKYIKENYFLEKIKNRGRVFTESKLKIAFAVTEAGEDARAGDFFTAFELAESLKKLGYQCTYLTRRKGDWYNVKNDVDIIISMIDAYDLNKIKNKSRKIITFAWVRNWPDRWIKNPSFQKYDIVLASSRKLCNILDTYRHEETILFPIATNHERFIRENNIDLEYDSDYAFTGNYWGKKREIEDFLDPKSIPYKFSLYGSSWQEVPKFKSYHKGFVQYQDIPKVYSNTKIVIDDAVVGITKPYGSVNSRVFDAIAAGCLVLTNGIIGAKDIFGEMLPVYGSQEELHHLLNSFLSDDDKRAKKINELRSFVLGHHTYRHRALKLKNVLIDFIGLKKDIAIKIPVPNWNEAQSWGDYHLALGLKKSFIEKNYNVIIQVLSEWNNDEGNSFDIVILFRGLSKYKIKSSQLNIMWNISHPEKVSIEEYRQFDVVFVASFLWKRHLQSKIDSSVETLLQCTDPDLFKPVIDKKYKNQLLFIGNSRKVFRKALKYLLPTSFSLSVYGKHWEEFIEDKYIKGEYIPNDILYKYYSNADIVLNDHWDSMRKAGFISNRVFDVLACNGFLLTDAVEGIEQIFPDVVTYSDKEDFMKKIHYYMENFSERHRIQMQGREMIIKNHTYDDRVKTIIGYVNDRY